MARQIRGGVMGMGTRRGMHAKDRRLAGFALCVSAALGVSGACADAAEPARGAYAWERLTASAAFPKSYNFPVHVARDGRFVLLSYEQNYESRDAKSWTRAALPPAGLNSAYLSYVAHEGSTFALGAIEGNYERFTIDPRIRRTDDHRGWRDLGRAETLPRVVFYAAASFAGHIWIIGGYDGRTESDDVWRSADGVHWERVVDAAPFGARMGSKAVVFKGRLFLVGGGELDGASRNDVWSSADGVSWRRETDAIAEEAPVGFSPVDFEGNLWLVGANRSGAFASEMLVSADGRQFEPVSAPWTPRGGVAVWTAGDGLYITGGKYSVGEGEATRFIYSNDVWKMRRQTAVAD